MESIIQKELQLKQMREFGGKGGGCVCSGQGYETDIGQIYAKFCPRKSVEEAGQIFEGEYASLQALAETNTVRVPKPIKVCRSDNNCCLVTEYLDMDSLTKNRELGIKISDLHLHNSRLQDSSSVHHQGVKYVDKFGFHVPTCCGIIPQPNTWTDSWVDFFARHKLECQVDMLMKKYGDRELKELWPRLVRKVPEIIDVEVVPSLLHGDMWGGNVAQVGAEPVVFDPASFYGHAEFDLAIAMMFGGFSSQFFVAYFERCPKMEGFGKRIELYKLFHYLNHWNHFGTGYRGQSLSIMRMLV